MRIAIVSKIPMFPTTGGNRARILTLVQALHAMGCEVFFILIPSRQLAVFDEEKHVELLGAHRFVILEFTLLARIRDFAKKAFYSIHYKLYKKVKRKTALRNSPDYLFEREITSSINDLFEIWQPRAVVIVYVHFSAVLDSLNSSIYKIIDTQDAFFNEFTAEAESKGLNRADKIIAIQDKEADYFRSILPRANGDKVATIGHITISSERAVLRQNCAASFVGSLFEANIISILYFVNDVLPAILKEVPDFRLYVGGSICDVLQGKEGVIPLGKVDRLLDLFEKGPILINSIRAGTGLKIKLIDAMALGLPVISTVRGVEGLPDDMVQCVEVIDDDDAAAFAAAVIKMCLDENSRAKKGAQAFECSKFWNERQRGGLRTILEEVKRMSA